MLAQLEVVVEEPYETEPHCGEHHQEHVHVGELAHEETGHHDSGNDDYATHGGGACLFELTFEVEVAHNLADLHFLQLVDDRAAHEYCEQQSQHESHSGAECDIFHEAYAGYAAFLEYVEKIV